MYLCLSSASREGYSKDVVDTLAAPVGGERQFRYDQKWVEPSIRALAREKKLPPDTKCLLCFVDLRGNPQEPFLLPLREAILKRVIPVGTTFTLIFELGEFRRPLDLHGFSEYARQQFPELHRYHDHQGKQEPTGFLWMDVKSSLDTQLKPQVTDKNWAQEWEDIVRDYLKIMTCAPKPYSKNFLDESGLTKDEFKDRSPFYVFYNLRPLPNGDAIHSATSGGRSAFPLYQGSNYELSFYHYHPTKSFPDVSLKLTATDESVKFTSNQEHKFNTRYDVKRFHFSTTSLLTGASGSILVSRIFHGKPPAEAAKPPAEAAKPPAETVDDIYLNYDIPSSKGKIALYSLLIAAAFAVPQLLTLAQASPATNTSTYVVVIVAALALGFLATLKDVLKLK